MVDGNVVLGLCYGGGRGVCLYPIPALGDITCFTSFENGGTAVVAKKKS